LIVNPCLIDQAAHAMADALSMSDGDQSRRMRAMRAVVAEFNTYRWAGEMLADGARLRRAPSARRAASPATVGQRGSRARPEIVALDDLRTGSSVLL
jgi:trehalose-6-phosphate synthase